MGRGHAVSSSVPITQPQTCMGSRVMVHDHIPLPHPPACCKLIHLSCLALCNPWTLARQAPLSMRFSRQEYWSGLSCPLPGDLPDPGIQLKSIISPALTGGSLPLVPRGKSLLHALITLKSFFSVGMCACISVFLVWGVNVGMCLYMYILSLYIELISPLPSDPLKCYPGL